MAFDREKIVQIAQKHVDRRRYDKAILEYQRIVEQDPTDARTLLRIGDLQARLGNYADAVATYDRVALFYSERGFALKAVAVFKQIRELIDRHVPHLADQYAHISPKLAQIYAELGLTSDALATYDAVARGLQARGRDREAVEVIRKMVPLERGNPLPYLRLAEALCRVPRLDEAIEHFWTAGQLLIQQRRSEDALKVLERILHFRPDPPVARLAAQLYLSRGSREAALQALARLQLCFESDPRDLDTLGLLAQAFDQIDQPLKSIEVYKEMLRVATESGAHEVYQRCQDHLRRAAPNDPEVRALLGGPPVAASPPSLPQEVVGKDQKTLISEPPSSIADEEIEFLEDAELVEPEIPGEAGPASERAAAQREPVLGPRGARVGQPPLDSAGAEPAVERALADAEVFRGLKLYSKAAASLRAALKAAPESDQLRAALAQVLFEVGDRAGAVKERLALAALYVDRRNWASARQQAQLVESLSPGSPEVKRLLQHVSLLEQRDRLVEAEPAPESADRSFISVAPASIRSLATGPAVSLEPEALELELDEPLPAYPLEEPVQPGALPRFQFDTSEDATEMQVESGQSSASSSLPELLPELDDHVVYVASDAPAGRSSRPGSGNAAAKTGLRVPPLPPIVSSSFPAPSGPSSSVPTARVSLSADGGAGGLGKAAGTRIAVSSTPPLAPVMRSAPSIRPSPESSYVVQAEDLRSLSPGEVQPSPKVPAFTGDAGGLPRQGSRDAPAAPEGRPLQFTQGRIAIDSVSKPMGRGAQVSLEPPFVPAADLDRATKPPPVGDKSDAESPQASAAKLKPADPRASLKAGSDVFSAHTGMRLPPVVQPASDAVLGAPIEAAIIEVTPPATRAPHSVPEALTATLEEAEFFAARGLPEDAITLLSDELTHYPEHPALLQALARLGWKRSEPTASSSDGTLGGLSRTKFSADGMLDQQTDVDAALDFAALDGPSEDEIDVDAVFSKFKEGVRAHVPETDSATHYDLAVAYQEMGLVEDALSQFEVAAKDPKRTCTCLAMAGLLHRQMGRLDLAAEAIVRGLSAHHKTPTQELGLYYELGDIYEAKGDADEALYYFQRVEQREPSYRDVAARIDALRPKARRSGEPSRRNSIEADFDRAFDDLQKAQ